MAGNDNKPKAEFTPEGELVVSLSKNLIAGDVNSAFRVIQDYMLANDLKVSRKVLSEFETANLVANSSQKI